MNRPVIEVALIAGAHLALCALGTDVGAADGNGYKGIPWGTACEDAIARLENSGVEFRTFNSSTRREGFANSASSGGPLGYGDWYIPNAWCPGNDTAMTAAFGSGSPYAEAAGSAGDVDFTAYCRTGRFVGVQMSAEASSPEGRRAVHCSRRPQDQPSRRTGTSAPSTACSNREVIPPASCRSRRT